VTISSLKNAKEFDLVNKNGAKKHGSYLILILTKNFTPINALPILINQPAAQSNLNYIALGDSEKTTASSKEDTQNNIAQKNLTLPIFFGMKVSRKLSKKAVVRNKIKRRIRNMVRDLAKNSAIDTERSDTKNVSFIIIPKKEFITANFKKLKSDFYTTFLKAYSS
jgi:ribonuclease P protein component